jgi:methyl-accepting chemotaxis protein
MTLSHGLRFRSRIGAAFGCLLLIIAALGGLGVRTMDRLAADTDAIATTYMTGAGHLARMGMEAQAMRLTLRRAVQDGQVGQDTGEGLRKFELHRQAFAEQSGLYEATIRGGQEAQLYAAFKDHWARYMAAVGKVRAAMEKWQYSEAVDLLSGTASEQQGAATGEIARSIHQTAINTHEVTANIADVSASTGEVSAAASEMLQAAGALSTRSDRLTATVHAFITGVRAA